MWPWLAVLFLRMSGAPTQGMFFSTHHSAAPLGSTLLQIFLGALRLAHQKRDMLFGGGDEAFDDLHGLFKFLGEFELLLVAPAGAQADQLAVQGRQLLLQIMIELLEILRKAPELRRIDNRLGHDPPPPLIHRTAL